MFATTRHTPELMQQPERMGVEESLTNLTRKFKSLKVPKRAPVQRK